MPPKRQAVENNFLGTPEPRVKEKDAKKQKNIVFRHKKLFQTK
jgi:hypothetical protein